MLGDPYAPEMPVDLLLEIMRNKWAKEDRINSRIKKWRGKMSGHLKQKVGDTVTHSFVDPKDVVIEKVNDEYIIEIDCGYPTERTFTFQHIAVDIFINDDIILGVNNPDELEPFFDVTELVVEYPKDQGIGAIEIHCAR